MNNSEDMGTKKPKAKVQEIVLEYYEEEPVQKVPEHRKNRKKSKKKSNDVNVGDYFSGIAGKLKDKISKEKLDSISNKIKSSVETVKNKNIENDEVDEYEEYDIAKKIEPRKRKTEEILFENPKYEIDLSEEDKLKFMKEEKNTTKFSEYQKFDEYRKFEEHKNSEKQYAEKGSEKEKEVVEEKNEKIKISNKRPSLKFSAKMGAIAEKNETKEKKSIFVFDRDFRRFAGIAVSMIVLFGISWYGFKYYETGELPGNTFKAVSLTDTSEPSLILSSRATDLITTMGTPKVTGNVEGTSNFYLLYEIPWFGFDTETRIIYGSDYRVYSCDVKFVDAKTDSVYRAMTESLREPVIDKMKEAEKTATWYVNSALYTLKDTNGVATLTVQTPYYDNTNNYPIAPNSIVVLKQGEYDVTGDGKPDVIAIIGEKESYLYKEYRKMHLTIWDGENVMYLPFPDTAPGGMLPHVKYEDMDKDGIMDIIVESGNINGVNTAIFTVKMGEIKYITPEQNVTTPETTNDNQGQQAGETVNQDENQTQQEGIENQVAQ